MELMSSEMCFKASFLAAAWSTKAVMTTAARADTVLLDVMVIQSCGLYIETHMLVRKKSGILD
jgi:hypothetical protein